MYDRTWAQGIVTRFRNDRTRTINLDLCIIERSKECFPEYQGFTTVFINRCLVHALQEKLYNKWWRAYQKLQRTSPLDMAALDTVVQWVTWCAMQERDRLLQLTFGWEGA